MRAIVLMLVLVACVDQAGSIAPPFDPMFLDGESWDPFSDPQNNGATCVANCYTIVFENAFMPPLNPATNQPWDADGSLPDPYALVRLNGSTIGVTTTWSESMLIHYPSIPAYAARWHQVVATTEIHIGDQIWIGAFDDSGYLITKCSFKADVYFLNNGEIACLEAIDPIVGQLAISFIPEF